MSARSPSRGQGLAVNGLIDDCGKIVGAGKEPMGWFDVSTLKEPYRIEGKKTMGLELADQMGWELPDVIFYPTGGGTGLIGMWKAFNELREIGWISGDLPRMVAVQSSGCAPIVRAYDAGERHADRWEDAATIARASVCPPLSATSSSSTLFASPKALPLPWTMKTSLPPTSGFPRRTAS